jgi:hypothetical protein
MLTLWRQIFYSAGLKYGRKIYLKYNYMDGVIEACNITTQQNKVNELLM